MPPPYCPTAVQEVVEGHEAPLKYATTTAGFGVGWIVQTRPSQPSARSWPPPLPTATHIVAVGQDTPFRELAPELGVVWRPHVTPFHCSARVTGAFGAMVAEPTAMQLALVGHETPLNCAALAPAGSTGARAFQALPFHDSAAVIAAPDAVE